MAIPQDPGATYDHLDDIRRILELKSVAVVGLSPDPFRPSHRVALCLQRQGYRIIPVNPFCELVLNERSYPDLESVPVPVDVVDVFRKPKDVGPVVDAAIRVGAKAVWLQEGVVDALAAERARRAGLLVVMDRCMLKEHVSLREQAQLPDAAR